jgi:hypothetical protein
MYLDYEQADAVLDVVQHTQEFVAVWNAQQRERSAKEKTKVSSRKAISEAAYQVIMDKLLVVTLRQLIGCVPDDLLLEAIDKIFAR